MRRAITQDAFIRRGILTGHPYNGSAMMFSESQLATVATALSLDARFASERARKLGLHGLLFDLARGEPDLTTLSSSGIREFSRVLARSDQRAVGLQYSLAGDALRRDADFDAVLHRADVAMRCVSQIGAPLVCLTLGRLPEPATEPAQPKVRPEEAGLILIPSAEETEKLAQPAPRTMPPPDPVWISQLDEAMSALGESADRYSTVLAFRSDLASFAALARLLRSVDCPWFGVDLDPGSVLADAWSLEQVFDEVGPLVRHVRLRDAASGAGGRTSPVPLGAGDVDLAALLRLLGEADYASWLTIDPTGLADAKSGLVQGLQALRAFL